MVSTSWFAAAALAPVTVWLLWRIQALAVDQGLRRALLKLLSGTKWLYSLVSWLGTFLHEVSHALVLLLGGHGIKGFRAGVDSGQVMPRRTRRSALGTLSFLAAAMAPIYLPPALLLGLLWWLQGDVVLWVSGGPGLDPAVEVLRSVFVDYPSRVGRATAGLDLASWEGGVLFALVLVALPSSRPSFVKGSRFHEGDEGDIAVIRRRIKRRPWPFLAFLVVVYALYFALVPFWPAVYWGIWQVVWLVALTGIAYALFAAVVWYLVARATRAAAWVAWVPVAAFAAVQAFGRAPLGWSLWTVNAVSLAAFAGLALAAPVLVPRHRF